jgi:Tfp pilus assembly PilM family ATPase
LARFLALDWDHQHLLIVAGTAKHGAVRIQKAVAFEEGQNPYNAVPAALGALLKERLHSAGISGGPVLACIGRDRLILKDLRFPSVGSAEEPALVRFQVAKELNDPAEQVIIDYVTAPDTSAQREKKALAVVVKRNVLAMYQELCKAAGLRLHALTPRPFGTLACLNQQVGTTVLTPAPEPPGAAMAVLTVGKPWAEFCVVQGETLLFARSLTTGPTLANEVRRNLAVYAGQSPQNPIGAVYVAATGEHAAVRERLQSALDIPVYALDAFAGSDQAEVPADQRGSFSGAVGLLHARSEAAPLPINFVAPKEPRPTRDPNRVRALVGAAVGVLILLTAVGIGYAEMAKRDTIISELNQKKMEQEQDLARYDDDQKRLRALDDWNKKTIVWLDELYDLTDQFPDIKNLRVSQLTCNDQPSIRGNKDKYVGHMSVKVLSTSQQESLRKLEDNLSRDSHLRPDGGKDLASNRPSFQFALKCTFKYDVERLQPDQFDRQISDAVAAPKDRRVFRGPGGSPRRPGQ